MVGCLIEKQLTTPQQYPLTLNSLVIACNQTSNRDPIVAYEEGLVQRMLASLKEAGLVRFVYPSSGRSATRYRHVLGESLGLEEKGLALLAVLLLRGPQTAGELRTRTERMARFEGLGEVAAELAAMAARSEPLVLQLGRRPGQKEERWMQLLAPESQVSDSGGGKEREARPYHVPAFEDGEGVFGQPVDTSTRQGTHGSEAVDERLRILERDVEGLRAEVAELRATVELLEGTLGQ